MVWVKITPDKKLEFVQALAMASSNIPLRNIPDSPDVLANMPAQLAGKFQYATKDEIDRLRKLIGGRRRTARRHSKRRQTRRHK
jgi:hypothetical protein